MAASASLKRPILMWRGGVGGDGSSGPWDELPSVSESSEQWRGGEGGGDGWLSENCAPSSDSWLSLACGPRRVDVAFPGIRCLGIGAEVVLDCLVLYLPVMASVEVRVGRSYRRSAIRSIKHPKT